MIAEDFIAVKKFEELFDGAIFHEEPGNRWIYEKEGHYYALPSNFIDIVKKSIKEEKDYLISAGTEVEYDPDVLY